MCRILSVGRDRHLMAVRSLLLRASGHLVSEAYSGAEALRMLGLAPVDLVLLCHTLSAAEHVSLIDAAHGKSGVPVICLIAREGDGYPNCLNVENSPDALLEAIQSLGLVNRPLRSG